MQKTLTLSKKNKYAFVYNNHAQNYTKYAQNGAFTNGTPYMHDLIRAYIYNYNFGHLCQVSGHYEVIQHYRVEISPL